MIRHAIKNFRKELGIDKFKKKWSSNKNLKLVVIITLIFLSVFLLFLSQRAKVLSATYVGVVTNEVAAKNFAAICKIKPEMGMCVDFVELTKINSQLSAYYFLWKIVFFVYWWLWVWSAFDDLIKKFKKKFSF